MGFLTGLKFASIACSLDIMIGFLLRSKREHTLNLMNWKYENTYDGILGIFVSLFFIVCTVLINIII
jgi:hypothetical protein